MQPVVIVLSAIMALALPGSASPVAIPNGQLEARQGRDSIRLFSSKDWTGEWADVAITAYDQCSKSTFQKAPMEKHWLNQKQSLFPRP